jgi:hypothetical protein
MFAEDSDSGAAQTVPLCRLGKLNKEPPTRTKIFATGGRSSGSHSEDPTSTPQVILQVSHFGDLALAVRHEFQPQVPTRRPQATECKKGKSVAQPPILYVPPSDLIEKRETKQIKVKMPYGANFGVAAFAYGTNEDNLVYVIAVLRIIKKKGLVSDIKVAWDAIIKV